MTEQQINQAIALKLAELKLGNKATLALVSTEDHREINLTSNADIWGNAK